MGEIGEARRFRRACVLIPSAVITNLLQLALENCSRRCNLVAVHEEHVEPQDGEVAEQLRRTAIKAVPAARHGRSQRLYLLCSALGVARRQALSAESCEILRGKKHYGFVLVRL